MVTSRDSHVIPAAEAARLALITYRQLDHWARQGWITPSVQSGSGRGGRRLYSVDDVLRLAALRHFAKAGWQVTELGERVAEADLTDARWLALGTESGLVPLVDADALHELLTNEERFTVFDVGSMRARITDVPTPTKTPVSLRRTA